MTPDLLSRVRSAIRGELGEFTSPSKLDAAARAVLEAIRDPTDEMCDAAHDRDLVPPDVALYVWRVMVDV